MTQFGKAGRKASFGKKTGVRAPARRTSASPAVLGTSVSSRDDLSAKAQSFLQDYKSEPASRSASFLGGLPSVASSSQGKIGEKPASWSRLLAYLIDTFLISVPFWIIAWPMFSSEMDAVIASTPESGETVVLKWLLYYGLVKAVYAIATEGSSLQATFGKIMLGLIVTNNDMTKPGLGSVIMRNTVARIILNMIPFYIGHSMILWTARKKGLHDFMSGTMVCRKGGVSSANYAEVFA